MKLLGKTLIELLDLINQKAITSPEVRKYFLNRSNKYNKKLNTYITIPNKLKDYKGFLKGIPIAIKDNFLTRGLITTAASNVLKDFNPPYNATVVERLLNKGGSVLGKTNMDAWAHGSSTETSDYGSTKNPWDITRSPGGSSGGSAAVVSSYLAPIAIGSETAGSIRQPAAWCGVVGLKPTYGRVSRYGVIAMGSSLDSPGVFALSVKDCALVLSLIAGKDSYDATTSNIEVPNYKNLLNTFKKYKIGIPEEYLQTTDKDLKTNIYSAIKIYQKMGHKIKKIKLLNPQYSISVYTILQRAEVSSNLSRYDGLRYGKTREYFGKEAKKRIILGTFTLSQGYIDQYYKKAQKIRTLIIEDFEKAFREVDLILAPSTPNTAMKLGESEKYPFFGELMDRFNEPSSVAGLPGISIPIGLDKKNLPTSLQIIGKSFDEISVLDLANQFELETNFFNMFKKVLQKFP
ncbi:MAG: amidase family protein [bacterium]